MTRKRRRKKNAKNKNQDLSIRIKIERKAKERRNKRCVINPKKIARKKNVINPRKISDKNLPPHPHQALQIALQALPPPLQDKDPGIRRKTRRKTIKCQRVQKSSL